MKTLRILLFSALIAVPLFSSCNNDKDENNTQQNLDAEISKVHKNLEILLGKDVPSISVLIDGPKGTYFTSSVGKMGKQLLQTLIFVLPAIPKILQLQLL